MPNATTYKIRILNINDLKHSIKDCYCMVLKAGVVSPARFELTTSELGILRSIQLSYEDKFAS